MGEVCFGVDGHVDSVGFLRVVDVVYQWEEVGEAIVDGAEGSCGEVAVAAGPGLGTFV